MDESVKRRERLKAMQSEASSQGGAVPLHDFGNSASPSSPYLCNLLLNPTPSQPIHGDSNPNSISRFDYYTDPLSAFSGTKKSKQDSQISFVPPRRPSLPYMPPSPSYHQLPPPYSPGFRTPQVYGHFFPLSQQQHGIPPGMRSPYGPMNSARGNSFIPYHSGHGIGPWKNRDNHHSSSNMGRGRGQGQGRGNFVRPGGGWTGSRNQSSEVAPGLYYDKSSVEDPWKFLMPVTWEGRKCLIMESSRIFMVKKPETISQSSKWSGGGPSLAEFLTDSLSEAAA